MEALTVFKLLVNTCSFDRFSEQEDMRTLPLLFVLKHARVYVILNIHVTAQLRK